MKPFYLLSNSPPEVYKNDRAFLFRASLTVDPSTRLWTIAPIHREKGTGDVGNFSDFSLFDYIISEWLETTLLSFLAALNWLL